MGWDTVEKQTIHYISCDAAKKKKKKKMVGPREMHKNSGTLTVLTFYLPPWGAH